jgi:hypothetical protein
MRSRRPKRDKSTRTCPTGKVRYHDHASAVSGMRGTQEKRGEGGAQRSYECKLCKGWHLTHIKHWRD